MIETKTTIRVDMRPGQVRMPKAMPPSRLPMLHTAMRAPAAPLPATLRAAAMADTSIAAKPTTMANTVNTRNRTPTERSAPRFLPVLRAPRVWREALLDAMPSAPAPARTPDAATAADEPSTAVMATASSGPTMKTNSVRLDSMLYVVSSSVGSVTTEGHRVRAQTRAGGWKSPMS